MTTNKTQQTINNILNEITMTETSYVNGLYQITRGNRIERILNYVENNPQNGGLDQLDMNIFRNGLNLLQEIFVKHNELLPLLEALEGYLNYENVNLNHLQDTISTVLADLSTLHADFVIFHGIYGSSLCHKFVQNNQLAHIFHGHNSGQSLGDLLILPVQRMPRYGMLFSELAKRVPGNDPLAEFSEVLKSKCIGLCLNINSYKAAYDSIKESLSLFENTDTRFRRATKTYLNSLMSDEVNDACSDSLKSIIGLEMTTRGKIGSNKRYYDFSMDGRTVFSIKLNRNMISTEISDYCRALTMEQQKQIYSLLANVIYKLETNERNAHEGIKNHLSLLAGFDFYPTQETVVDYSVAIAASSSQGQRVTTNQQAIAASSSQGQRVTTDQQAITRSAFTTQLELFIDQAAKQNRGRLARCASLRRTGSCGANVLSHIEQKPYKLPGMVNV